MLEKLVFYFQYPFVRYALIVGILIALCSSLLGLTLVLKRFSFIGDGLSHVAFGALAAATVAGFSNKIPFTLLVTILVALLILRTGQSTAIKGDAAIAMLSVGALAFGYLLLNLFPPEANFTGAVLSTLFGSTSLLTLSEGDVRLCLILSILVVMAFILAYNKLFAVTFDPDFARAVGTPVGLYNFLIGVVTAIIIVLAMNLVGSLLTSALLIFPALSAMRLFKSFRGVTLFSALLSVLCTSLGMVVSIVAGTPVGATIVMVDLLAFAVCALLGWALRKRG